MKRVQRWKRMVAREKRSVKRKKLKRVLVKGYQKNKKKNE